MKTGNRDQGSEIRGPGSAEETLLRIARLAAPEGLEERVQASLRAAIVANHPSAKILRWPKALRMTGGWMQSTPMRAAAAAAIAAVVVGGGWIVSSRLPASQPASAVALPVHPSASGGFASAGAMRTPQTLVRPTVEAHAAPSPAKTPATQPRTAANQPLKMTMRSHPAPAGKPVAKTLR
jgi:hypothetical protein